VCSPCALHIHGLGRFGLVPSLRGGLGSGSGSGLAYTLPLVIVKYSNLLMYFLVVKVKHMPSGRLGGRRKEVGVGRLV
jgi:hypothetical protein